MREWVVLAINLIFDLFVVGVVSATAIITGTAIIVKFKEFINEFFKV